MMEFIAITFVGGIVGALLMDIAPDSGAKRCRGGNGLPASTLAIFGSNWPVAEPGLRFTLAADELKDCHDFF